MKLTKGIKANVGDGSKQDITPELKVQRAVIAGLVSAGFSALLVVLSLFGVKILDFDIWASVDVALILLLTYGIYKHSRFCAVAMLVYFVLGKVLLFSTATSQGFHLNIGTVIFSLIFLVYFWGGVEGTFWIHRNKKVPQEVGIKQDVKSETKYRNIPKFTIGVIAVIFLVFFAYWSYKFGVFTPERGTSIASIGALWGQILASFLATVTFGVILLLADLRSKPTPIYKLVSLYLLVGVISWFCWAYASDKQKFGKTHEYKLGQQFSYLQYIFTVDATLQDVVLQDCSSYSTASFTPYEKYQYHIYLKADCERNNTSVTGMKQVAVSVTIKNTEDKFNFFTDNWFLLTSNTGKEYELKFTGNNKDNINQVPPNGQIAPKLITPSHLQPEETIYSIRLKVDNHAEQIIKAK